MSDKTILLCPGQGAQSAGMGRVWFESSHEAKAVFAEADRVLGNRLGSPLSEICFTAAAETINRTDVAQPAIYTVSVACHRTLAATGKLAPDSLSAAAGLSLGEYTALHLAGTFEFAEGLKLVALRGRVMQEAGEASRGGMVALIGADEEKAHIICESAAKGEILVPANFNAPGQIVLSGSTGACERAALEAEKHGVRAARLAVAGAFHSPLMAPAAERLGEALANISLASPRCPVVSNVTAQPHGAGPDAGVPIIEGIRRRLVEQLTAPVRWDQSCRWLAANMKGEHHELAPGKVLAGLMRRIDRNVKVQTHDQPSE